MKAMGKWAMGAVAMVFSMEILANPVQAAGFIVGDNGVVIKAPNGGPTTISRDGGQTWAPYKVPPRPPKVQPVPQLPKQKCDIYRCGNTLYAVPAGTPGPQGTAKVGTSTIDGRTVNPKTNVLR